MRTLDLDDLKKGKLLGLSKNVGAFLAEAAIVCLHLNGHQNGALLKVTGAYQLDFQLIWKDDPDSDTLKNWRDLNETVEYGASAIALLLIDELTEFTFSTRAVQLGLADYMLSKKGSSFGFEDENPAAYLEVSGILNESPVNTIDMRLNIKEKKLGNKSENAPIFIVIAEFSAPKAKILVAT
ncbi:MAG: hypothetical protein IPN76_21440 [Saprospiraceae bacterium]|nr:hypothetical protein [Saprospiraceae bacterium]